MTSGPAPWQVHGPGSAWLGHLRARWNETDHLGHINNAVYLTWMEQVAVDHAQAVGYGTERLPTVDGVFIARRHEIDYLRPAFGGDRVLVVTWPESISGARAFRRYQIFRLDPSGPWPALDRLVSADSYPNPDGELLVTARTEWAYVDRGTGRPRRVPPELVEAFTAVP